MKLVFAAPESGLPSLLTAFDSHASSLHFLMKLVLAAPASGLPSLLTALLAHDCAIAAPIEKEVIRRATKIRFIITSICCSAIESTRMRHKLLYARSVFRDETLQFSKSSLLSAG